MFHMEIDIIENMEVLKPFMYLFERNHPPLLVLLNDLGQT